MTKVNAEYRRSVQAFGWTGSSYTCGAECPRDRLIKLEMSQLNVSGTNLHVSGLMYVIQKQNYFDQGDHEYLFEVKANGQSAYWQVSNTNVNRTNTHREKNDLRYSTSQAVYPFPFCNSRYYRPWENHGLPVGHEKCDVAYDSVGFDGYIPMNEIYEFMNSVGASSATMNMLVWNKTEGGSFNGNAIYYEEIHTVFPSSSVNTSNNEYNVKIDTYSDSALGQVIEDNVIIRGANGHPDGGTLNQSNHAGLLPAYNTPGIECSHGDNTGRMMFTYGPYQAPRTFDIVHCGNEGKYCSSGIPYATVTNMLGNQEAISDQQGGYKLRFYCYPNYDWAPIYVHTTHVADTVGEYHGWIAASAFRVTGRATVITVKPNKRTFVDQIVVPTQECTSGTTLLVKAHCDPCGDGKDTIRVTYGGKTKNLEVTGLTKTPKEFKITMDATGCSNGSNGSVPVTATPTSSGGTGMDSVGYLPNKKNLVMSCNNTQTKKEETGVVLTAKNRGDATQTNYNEKVRITTLKGPGTIKAGTGFEYPVGYEYTVDAGALNYPSILSSSKFNFNPTTKFYTSNLADKLNTSYPQTSIYNSNPSVISSSLSGIYDRNMPYTVTYQNNAVSYTDLSNAVTQASVGKRKLTQAERVLVIYANGSTPTSADALAITQAGNRGGVNRLVASELPQTWIEKGSGYVYNKASSATVTPVENGGNKVYTTLDLKAGKYYFSVSGDKIGLNQMTFVLPKCAYNVTCNPLSEECDEPTPTCDPKVEVCDPNKQCDPTVEVCDEVKKTQAVFRIISLKTPFPGRSPGANWKDKTSLIRTDAYNSSPEYKATLNRGKQNNIQTFNRNYSYLYYKNLYYDSTAKIWRSRFIDSTSNYGVTRYK